MRSYHFIVGQVRRIAIQNKDMGEGSIPYGGLKVREVSCIYEGKTQVHTHVRTTRYAKGRDYVSKGNFRPSKIRVGLHT